MKVGTKRKARKQLQRRTRDKRREKRQSDDKKKDDDTKTDSDKKKDGESGEDGKDATDGGEKKEEKKETIPPDLLQQAKDSPRYYAMCFYQLVFCFFMTLIPNWNPNPEMLGLKVNKGMAGEGPRVRRIAPAEQ